jgi:tetratricopeptide (TPR) repeat protein
MGKTFHKYRTDSEYTEQILISGQVYLSTAEGLNDPFECSLQEIGKDWIEQQVTQMKQAATSGFAIHAKRALDGSMPFFGLSRPQIKGVLSSIQNCKSVEDIYAFREQFILQQTGHRPADGQRIFSRIDDQLLAVGIFSMSVNPDHPLMWAHYAGDHSGICLGFDQTPDSRLAELAHCLPVIYSDSLPEMEKDGFKARMAFSLDDIGRPYTSSFKISFSDNTFQRAIATKPTCWSYEEEWRYIEPYDGLFSWPGPLSEITFGLKCNEERRNHYIRLAEEHVPNEVRLFQMCKIHGSNSLKRCRFGIPTIRPKQTTKSKKSVIQDSETLSQEQFVSRMERLIQQEKYGEVLFQVNENLKQDPDSPVLLHLKGVAHGYTQEHNKALECFTRLTEVCPDAAGAWYQMSCALIELGHYEEAIIPLKKAFEMDPNEKSIALNLGLMLLRVEEKPDEALVYLRRAESLGHRRAHRIIADIEGA